MKHQRTLAVAAATAVAALALVGCTPAAEPAPSASEPAAAGITADVDAARASIQPIIDGPTAFTVTEQLDGDAAGKRFAIIDCGTPICALMGQLAAEPAGLLGATTTVIQSGSNADSIAAAFATIVADDYDGVFVPALPFQLWERQFEELRAAGVPVVTTGVLGLPADFDGSMSAEKANESNGRWLAEWTIAQGEVGHNSVIYRTPELPFTNHLIEAYKQRIDELCDGCVVRDVDIPIATMGTTSSSIIVDDLSANPDTTLAVFSIGEQATGLPAALKVANIDVATSMFGAGPAQLVDIQNGDLDASLVLDSRALVWTLIDSLARQSVGQPVSAGAAADEPIRQFVTADNLSGDMSMGWAGYPDMVERFKTLWGIN